MAKKFIELRKDVSNIEDIESTVKALEKIAAANIHNLELATARMRMYEEAIGEFFSDINTEELSGDYFQAGKKGRMLVIMGPEEKLCGDITRSLLRFSLPYLKKDSEILAVGQYVRRTLEETGIKVNYFFNLSKEVPSEFEARTIRDLILKKFQSRQLSEVIIFYPSFQTLAVHPPRLFKFLPINKDKFMANFNRLRNIHFDNAIYEPSKTAILRYLTEEYLDLAFYEKILETKLSEFSARTIAMGEAEKKAKKLIKNLYHRYFRIKRADITKSITDLHFHLPKIFFYE